MPIEYIKGNLFEHVQDRDVIIHCCNNIGGWGSGFVVPLEHFAPISKIAYKCWFNNPGDCYPKNIRAVASGIFGLGQIQVVEHFYYADNSSPDGVDIKIVNMIGQNGVIGPDNPTPIDYEAIKSCLQKVAERIPNDVRIIAPLFGAGLAGGKWTLIEKLIHETLPGRNVVIFHLEDVLPL